MTEVQTGKLVRSKGLARLAFILFVALALRLGAFAFFYQANPAGIRYPDTHTYEEPALAFLAHGKFSDRPDLPDVPMLLRTPGYPAFIAGVYAVFGPNEVALVVMQIILSLGTISLVWWISRQLWPEAASLAAAAWLAVDYLSLFYTQLLLSETLFTFWFVLALALGTAFLLEEKPQIGLALLFGFAVAVTAHVRPITYYASPALLFGLLLARRVLRLTWVDAARIAVAFSLPWVVLVAGWQLRNHLVAGTFQFSPVSGALLALYHAVDAMEEARGIPLDQGTQIVLRQVAEKASLSPEQLEQLSLSPMEPRVSGVSQAEIYEHYGAVGAAILKENAAGFAAVMAKHVVPLLFGPGQDTILDFTGTPQSAGNPVSDLAYALKTGSFTHFKLIWLEQYPWTFALLLVSVVQVMLLTFFAGVGVVASRGENGRRQLCHLLLLGSMLYMLALALGIGHSRHRVPCIPVLVLYAGYGLHCCYLWRCSRRPAANSMPAGTNGL